MSEPGNRDPFFEDCIRYLDGEMDGSESDSFERRLEEEPEASARFQRVATVDVRHRVARSFGPDIAIRSRPARAVLRLVLAAALLAAGWLLFVLLRGATPPHRLYVEVASVGVPSSQSDYNRLLGLDPDWLPAGFGMRSAGAGAERPEPAEYFEEVRAREERRFEAALGNGAGVAPAGLFVLVFRASQQAYAVVVFVPLRASIHRVYPEHGEPSRGFPAEQLHVLPGWPLSFDPGRGPGEDIRLAGYFNPPLGYKKLVALLALSRELVEPTALEALDARLREHFPGLERTEAEMHTAAETIRSWLEEVGMRVESALVEESGS